MEYSNIKANPTVYCSQKMKNMQNRSEESTNLYFFTE